MELQPDRLLPGRGRVRLVHAGGPENCLVSQPSLSQQVAKLERELGVLLFDRLGRSVRLTAAGVRFRDRVAPVTRLLADAKADLADDGGRGGRVVLGAIPTMASAILPGMLDLFFARESGGERRGRRGADGGPVAGAGRRLDRFGAGFDAARRIARPRVRGVRIRRIVGRRAGRARARGQGEGERRRTFAASRSWHCTTRTVWADSRPRSAPPTASRPWSRPGCTRSRRY